nr:PQQ-binding-like beta-propeller repeat protein [Acidobacteriota bacterium]NIO58558.1 PQQ-binding-like beta-propeller repeat protein [Acidobacteriota bacterium]NIQ29607.1 PQQ-binding-like beta-propeller repeat protein [Acidobacteriota bacterium]NIQ84317.1 PQQ-binding-like beta-propeller repeat protein [Acidobacteriota bacterium]
MQLDSTRYALAAFVFCLAVLPVGADDWPRFLGPTGDAKSAETGLDLNWPPSGPPLVWESDVGEGYTMPSIVDGKLFEFDRWEDKARLTCREAATGKELWRREYTTDYEDMYEYSRGPRGTPVVDGNRVYTYGVEGRLRCHAVEDGKLLWEVDTKKKFNVVQNFFGVGSTPVIEGDLLIAMVGGSPEGSPGIQTGEVASAGSAIVAFDKTTGEVRYSNGEDLASYASPVLATIDGRRRGFLFARGGLLGFDPA